MNESPPPLPSPIDGEGSKWEPCSKTTGNTSLFDKGKVIGFVVQYEMLIGDKWMPVVRYDTAHGYTHKDLLKPDGSKEKIFMGIGDLNEALTLADKDISENWERYKERYLRRLKT